MSKIANLIKKGNLLSVIVAVVIAVGLALGAICGFNTNETLKDSSTLTVSVNRYVYNKQLSIVEDICEEAFDGLKVMYEMKSEMSGDDCEIVYVFKKGVDLSDVETALEKEFGEATEKGGSLEGAFITVSTATEDVSAVLAKGYVLRAVIAAVVIAVLAFAYVAIRHSLGMGIVSAVSAIVGAGLTSAILLITRIPVTSAVAYAAAIGAMLSLVVTVLTLNKVHENIKADEAIEDTVVASVPVCTITTLAALGAGAMLLVGIVSIIGAGTMTALAWFAIAAILAMAVALFVGVIYTPALYCTLKGCVDKNLGSNAKSDYVGAKKTSTKEKKLFQKKAVEKEEIAEEKPCCCGCADCASEETAEEAVEVEEVPAEEVVEEEPCCCCGCEECASEETAEEVTEEVVEEVVEETAEESNE